MSELHVIFGAGQVGTPLATRLVAMGRRVRVARRSDKPVAEGAELAIGDATDPDFCRSAAEGATAVYHCMNPSEYTARAWERLVPAYMSNLIGAASAAKARLVVLDNLYMLGRTHGRPMTADTPMNPCSRKGEIRARAAQSLFDAHARGDVRAVCGRASDYYGPGARQTHLGDVFWKDAIKGKPGMMLIDPDAVHTYHCVLDVAPALAALGTAENDVLGSVWMLPCQPAETARKLVQRMSGILGREIRINHVPKLMRKALGLFMEPLREIDEMMYQWDEPFVVDDAPFRKRFGAEPVARDDAARATIDWAKRAYAA